MLKSRAAFDPGMKPPRKALELGGGSDNSFFPDFALLNG
jgi:hypothetical protein